MPSLRYLLVLIIDALSSVVMTPYNRADELAFKYLVLIWTFLLGVVALTLFLAYVYFTRSAEGALVLIR